MSEGCGNYAWGVKSRSRIYHGMAGVQVKMPLGLYKREAGVFGSK